MKDADTEHAQRIQQGDHQDREADRGRTGDRIGHVGRIGHIDELDHEDGIDRTHQQRSRISHKDLGRLEIEDQEGKQAAG